MLKFIILFSMMHFLHNFAREITQNYLNYIGNISIDTDLIEAVNPSEDEKVQVLNINNCERFEKYVIKAERDRGQICLNEPATWNKCFSGIVIILSFAFKDFEEVKNFKLVIISPETETNKLI